MLSDQHYHTMNEAYPEHKHKYKEGAEFFLCTSRIWHQNLLNNTKVGNGAPNTTGLMEPSQRNTLITFRKKRKEGKWREKKRKRKKINKKCRWYSDSFRYTIDAVWENKKNKKNQRQTLSERIQSTRSTNIHTYTNTMQKENKNIVTHTKFRVNSFFLKI